MELTNNRIIDDALFQPRNAMFYGLSRLLSETFPNKTIWPTEDYEFDIFDFEEEGLCTIRPYTGAYSDKLYSWSMESGVYFSYENSWVEIEWEGLRFQVLTLSHDNDGCSHKRQYLIADDESSATKFFATVTRWNSEIRGEVLVYSGHWYKARALFQSIQDSSLANLVLEGNLKEEIRDDFLSFFENKETYDRYGIPWKRGVLLLGPPGNGKTHTIKALINLLGRPCLYVKSFMHPHRTEHGCMQEVFDKARKMAPCVLVLEDLDTLLNDRNRSFFLNEMDGFASNAGIVTVATTNHPELLDPAILERPSRFDRKYTFMLPELDCRRTFLSLRNDLLEPALRLNDEELERVAESTPGFSFAYLKELFLSSMMQWIGSPEGTRLAAVMTTQVDTLRGQMKTELDTPTPPRNPRSHFDPEED